MKDKIKAAIETLLTLIDKSTSMDEALKYTQAILNLTHAANTWVE